jgi:lipopolysaccharide export LptBFGC system permease protein LptF
MKYIIFLLIFIIFLFYITNNLLIVNEKFTENFTENIIFLNSTELYQILINDYDNYYIKFYKNDKKMRNISNINQYKDYIKISVTHFDKKDKEKIER